MSKHRGKAEGSDTEEMEHGHNLCQPKTRAAQLPHPQQLRARSHLSTDSDSNGERAHAAESTTQCHGLLHGWQRWDAARFKGRNAAIWRAAPSLQRVQLVIPTNSFDYSHCYGAAEFNCEHADLNKNVFKEKIDLL